LSLEESAVPESDLETFLWEVHKYTNEYIRFADTKAVFTAGATTALIGGLAASSVFDSCLKVSFCQWSVLQRIGFAGLLLLSAAVALSIAAIRPRLWNKTPLGFIFWNSIAVHGSAIQFTRAVHNSTDKERCEAVSNHLFVLASIAKRKYAYVAWAIYTAVLGGSLAGTALFLQHAYR
jgi:hypothetical protein